MFSPLIFSSAHQYTDNQLTAILQDGVTKMTYEYDNYHNVIKATTATGVVYEFTYDAYGNNTSVSIVSGSTKITATADYSDDGNILESTTDALAKKTQYGYNVNTNVLEWVQYPEDTTSTRTEYTYDIDNRITIVQDSTTWTFTYDANGMRTKRTNGTTTYTYVYNGGNLSQMTVDGHTLRFSYDAQGPMFVKYDTLTYQYILNLQGDVIGIMDPYGSVVVQYTYDAWGNLLSTTGSLASTLGQYNPLRYRGYVYDRETELYYLQSRYYNPEWGRFINADIFVTTGQSFSGNNMFVYCGNNPVSREDDCGEWWNVVAGAAIGAIVGFVGAVVTEIAETQMSEGETQNFDWGDVWVSTGIGAAEGALTAIFPGAAVFISAGANVTETIIDGIDDNKTAREIVVDSIWAGAIGMVGSDGVGFVKGGAMNDAVNALGNAFGKGIHPKVRKMAQNTINSAIDQIGKEFGEGMLNSFAYGGLYEFASWYTNKAFDHI